MKKIEVVIEGTSPLLMHSAHNMEESNVTRNPAKQYNSEEDAEKVAYRTSKGELCVPARCIKACLIGASSWFKFGKKSAKQIIAGATRIEPVEILLNQKKYDIDKRPVVIQRARILRSRPRFDKWQLKFTLLYDETVVANLEVVEAIIEEGGKRVGLLDNRPQKYGENGTFRLVKFLPQK